MKKSSRLIFIIITCLMCLILIGFFYIYFMFNGTPWEKYKAKQETAEYLSHKYTQKMIINYRASYFNFKEENYVFMACPENNKDIWFSVNYYNKNNKPSFADRYLQTFWQKEIESEMNPFIQKIYSNKDTMRASIDVKPVAYDDEWNISHVPSFNEVKDEIEEMEFSISIERAFDNDNADIEYEKMFKVINFVNQKNYKVSFIKFFFKQNEDIGSWKHIIISDEELVNIKTAGDLKNVK